MVVDATDLAVHWDRLYSQQRPSMLSWYQESPAASLALFDALGVRPDQAVVDVGGGASTLADSLIRRGFGDLSVLDVSQTALDQARQRLGNNAALVSWLREHVLVWRPQRRYDVWHDRAAFHFLVDAGDRERYGEVLRGALCPGAHAIVATFAPDGPTACSGLPVARYDAEGIAAALGGGLELVSARRELHSTPAGVVQPFTFALLRRR